MREILLLLLMLGLFTTQILGISKKFSSTRAMLPLFYDTKQQQYIDFQQVVLKMNQSDVTFVGEIHDHILGHVMELSLFKALFSSYTKNIAISMEMFERDVQPIVTGYMQNQLSEQFFLQNSRPWGNYLTDYKPILETAKSLQLPLLAANIPRRYASFVADGNEQPLWQFPALEKSYMAPAIDAPHDGYYQKFYELFHPQGWPDDKIERYYRAQCIKDDTMAMSIAQYFTSNTTSSDAKLISYSGSFHTDNYLGLYYKVAKLLPQKKLFLISIVPVAEAPTDPIEYKGVADVVIFEKENPQ